MIIRSSKAGSPGALSAGCGHLAKFGPCWSSSPGDDWGSSTTLSKAWHVTMFSENCSLSKIDISIYQLYIYSHIVSINLLSLINVDLDLLAITKGFTSVAKCGCFLRQEQYISHGILRAWSRYGDFFSDDPWPWRTKSQRKHDKVWNHPEIRRLYIPNSQVIHIYIYIICIYLYIYIYISQVEVRQVGSIHLHLGIRWSGINHRVKWASPRPLGIDDVSAGKLLLNSSTLRGRGKWAHRSHRSRLAMLRREVNSLCKTHNC